MQYCPSLVPRLPCSETWIHRESLVSFSQALTLKPNPSPLPALISRLVTLTTPNKHAIVSTVGCHTPIQSLPVVLVSLSMEPGWEVAYPVPTMGPFTAKLRSHHVHVTLQVISPTSPCPTLSVHAEPACKRAETICSVQCIVWCNQNCTKRII